MDIYKDELAPWERRSNYYQKIQLGQNVESVKDDLKDQTFEMIQSRLSTTNAIIANPKMSDSLILEIGYDLKSVGDGVYGLKAAFEWGISDVVWHLELNSKFLSESLEALYKTYKPQVRRLFKDAKSAYGDGSVEEALEKFLELDKEICFDFATHITIGIIYFFHYIDKAKAGEYFEKALNYVRSTSHYYTGYVLLYNALIKRDFGYIEEAESCTREAIKICSNFTEAMYQNALYNALLKKPDVAIPLLKKVIKSDIIYCLKINSEQDFEGIRTEVNKLLEEIREEHNREASNGLKDLDGKVLSYNECVGTIKKLGYDLPKTFLVDSLTGGNSEVGTMISKNTIFDAYIAQRFLLQTGQLLQKKKLALKDKCQSLTNELENKIEDLGLQLVEENKKSPLSRFFSYFLLGQFIAVPIGMSLGIPVGIFFSELVLFALSILLNLGRSRNTGKDILSLEEKKEKLYWAMKKIKT